MKYQSIEDGLYTECVARAHVMVLFVRFVQYVFTGFTEAPLVLMS